MEVVERGVEIAVQVFVILVTYSSALLIADGDIIKSVFTLPNLCYHMYIAEVWRCRSLQN